MLDQIQGKSVAKEKIVYKIQIQKYVVVTVVIQPDSQQNSENGTIELLQKQRLMNFPENQTITMILVGQM